MVSIAVLRALASRRGAGGAGRGRRAIVWAAALASGLGLAACGSSASSASGGGTGSATSSPYIVGVVAAFNGPLAITGVGAQQAIKVFTSQTGGKLAGHPLEIVPINDQSIGANAIPAFRAYLAKHPKPTALIVANSVSALALAPTTEALHIPMFVVGEDASLQKYSNVEQIQPAQALWAQSATQYMKSAGIGTFAFMGPAAPSFDLLLADFQAGAKAAGVSLVDTERPSFTATDYQAEDQRIVAKKPQAVVVTVFGTGFITAVRELREDGYTGKIIFTDVSLTPQAVTVPALQGAIDIGWHASPVWGQYAKQFYDYYQTNFHAVPGIEVDDYEAVAELNAVIPKLQSQGKALTAANIMPAIISHGPFEALQGSSLTVNPDHRTIVPVSIWKLQNGTFERISGT
jgi:ABC-type branched-subunit amino acid transport system substrate-binding protein